jgi:hypothetical protein
MIALSRPSAQTGCDGSGTLGNSLADERRRVNGWYFPATKPLTSQDANVLLSGAAGAQTAQ